MWEYEVIVKATGKQMLLFGTSLNRACEKNKLNVEDVIVLFTTYMD